MSRFDALKLLIHDSEQQRFRNNEDSHKPIETLNDLASSDQYQVMPPYSCFCAVRDSHYNLEWYIQTSAIVSNKRVSQETHRQLHSDFKTTDVTILDYPTQFIDFQRGQHHHSSNMKYQATSSPTATHVVNDQSNFSNRTHTLPSLLPSLQEYPSHIGTIQQHTSPTLQCQTN